MSQTAEAAVIEIIEHTDDPDPMVIMPNDVRINGRSVLCPSGQSVVVHEISIADHELVQVTLTLFAKRVTISAGAAV